MTLRELENKIFPNPYISIRISNLPSGKNYNEMLDRQIISYFIDDSEYRRTHSCESEEIYRVQIEWTCLEHIEAEQKRRQAIIDNRIVFIYAITYYDYATHIYEGEATAKKANEIREKADIYIEFKNKDEYEKILGY